MSNGKVLISPSSFGACGRAPLELLERHGFRYTLNPYGRKLNVDEVLELAQGCVGIIAGVEPLTAEVLDQLPDLRCISRVGVGMQNVDLAHAERQGISVRNTPDGPTQAVAELTVGLALALLRRIPLADRNLRAGRWQKEMGFLLRDKVVGVVGLGSIGQAAAELFFALGCTVIGSDPVPPDGGWMDRYRVELLPLQDLLARSDIVTLHLAHEPGSPPVIGATELESMRPGAFLLNLARGDALDEGALLAALQGERIAGAALDVFTQEPYQGRLTEFDQVVLTPHLGSYASEARLRMEVLAVEHLLHALQITS